MPTYLHQCENPECNNEWEDFYSINKDPPKICPKCNQETAKRVICGNSKGVVELTGQDLIDKIKSDAKQIKRDAAKSERIYSNLLGETRYQQLQTQMDKNKR